ncbi:MAG: phosphoribosyl-ATP diphosphatase [Parvibaculales bacterium]
MVDSRQLDILFATIEARRGGSLSKSYSAQLLADLPLAARKLGEEAIETITAALAENDDALKAEAADLLYHLLVVLAARNVPLVAVMEILAARAGQSGQAKSGMAEKAARPKQS